MHPRHRIVVLACTCLSTAVLLSFDEKTASAQVTTDPYVPEEKKEEPCKPWQEGRSCTIAPPAPVVAARPRPPKTVWYGWQTLLIDAGVVVMWITAAAMKSTPVAWGGVHAYVVAPPLAHFGRGNTARGFADLGLRIGAPLVLATLGGGLGLLTEYGKGRGFGAATGVGAGLGIFGGYLLAVILDSAYLAREPVDVQRGIDMSRAPAPPPRNKIVVTPYVDAMPAATLEEVRFGSAHAGITGRF